MEMLHGSAPQTATIGDFFYFFYGVPILLALSSPDEARLIPLFFWLDVLQAVVAGCLAYIAIFAVLPFSGATQQPLTASLLVWTYDIENLILAVGATARLLSSPNDAQERRLFQILSMFLWVYAVCLCIYNHIVASLTDAGLLDTLADIPFAVLFLAVLFLPAKKAETARQSHKKPLALFIDNARPAMFALALVALGAHIARHHFSTGMVAIVFALAVYGLRSTILQGRYLRSQQALEEAKARLEEMALMDSLTSIANRRCFDQRLELEWSRSNRMQSPLSLLMIDIDYFKNLNDTHGHVVGDDCLARLAAALRLALTRGGDLLARYGGEEFAAILPGTGSEGARAVAVKLQAAVRDLNIENPTSIGACMSISIGLSTYELSRRGSPAMLIETADRALYQAKLNGRNRIEVLSIQESVNAVVTV
jgi:diguanylate cyclase (GGDEF)-like protein